MIFEGTKTNLMPTGDKKEKKRLKEPKVKEEATGDTGEKPRKKIKKKPMGGNEINLVEEAPKKEEDTAIVSKEEETKETDDFENHAQKLIQDVHNDKSLLENLKHLMERSDLNEIIMSLDFLTPVILEPLPTEPYLKQLENPVNRVIIVVKTTSAIKVEQLTKFICRKLNLNELKYNERIKVWIKKDTTYEVVDRQMTLKDIGNKYWSHLQKIDWEVYDLVAHVEEYLNKTSKPIQNERVLYYSVYFDDWL